MKAQSHNQPQRFQHIGNGKYYVNFNIYQDTFDDPEGEPVPVWICDYVKVDRLTRDTIIAAIIRDKYSIDQVEAIQNNFMNGDNVIDFLKLQAWREYAKLIADDATQPVIDALLQKQVYEVILPLSNTLPGGTYNELAERIMRMKVPYNINVIDNKVTAYPSWITEQDSNVLENDQNVTLNTINLFD